MRLEHLWQWNSGRAGMVYRRVQICKTLWSRGCTAIDKHSPQITQRTLCIGVVCRRVEGSRLIWTGREAACRSNENRQVPSCRWWQPYVIQVRDAHTFWAGIVTVHGLYQSNNAVLPRHYNGPLNVSAVRVGAHFCQEVRTHHVIHDVHNAACNKLLILRFPERDDKGRNSLDKDRKCEATAQSSGDVIYRFAQLDDQPRLLPPCIL